MKWSDVAQYARVPRALLHGDEAEWEGAARVRHQALHEQHLIAINDGDRPFITRETLNKP
jgi:hypothetical protein